jgi:hypothetical protein
MPLPRKQYNVAGPRLANRSPDRRSAVMEHRDSILDRGPNVRLCGGVDCGGNHVGVFTARVLIRDPDPLRLGAHTSDRGSASRVSFPCSARYQEDAPVWLSERSGHLNRRLKRLAVVREIYDH